MAHKFRDIICVSKAFKLNRTENGKETKRQHHVGIKKNTFLNEKVVSISYFEWLVTSTV